MDSNVKAEIIGIRILDATPSGKDSRFSIKFNLTKDNYTIQNKKKILDYNPDLSVTDIKTLIEDIYR